MRFLIHLISLHLNNALQVQPQILVQIASYSYADEFQKKYTNFKKKFSPSINGWLHGMPNKQRFIQNHQNTIREKYLS